MQSAKPIISIGAFTTKSIELSLMFPDTEVAVYEPFLKTYLKYPADAHNSRLQMHNVAVTKSGGFVPLTVIECGQGDFAASSTYYDGRIKITPPYKLIVFKTVAALSLRTVLSQFDIVSQLHINCEGEEMNLIDIETLSLFERCNFVHVGFHRFLPFLGITDEDVQRCVKLMSKVFDCHCTSEFYPNYNFYHPRCSEQNKLLAEKIQETY